jgi:hypothetical protein
MQKWEYAFVVIDTFKRNYTVNGVVSALEYEGPVPYHFILNQMGLEGWEMVNASMGRGGPGPSVFNFKRALES